MAWTNQGHVPTRTRRQILIRDDHRCVQCGHIDPTGKTLEVDHRDNTRGPRYNTDSNLQTLCTSCHEKKTRREITQGQRRRAARRRLPAGPHPGIVG